jgi:hypothetical protein
MGWLGWIVTIVVVVIIVITIIDIATVPATCALDKNILLPDSCRGSCPVDTSKAKCCTTTATRPYAVFFTQAAACACPTIGCGSLGENKKPAADYVAAREKILSH